MIQETLKNLLPKFIDSLKVKGRSPSTVLAYRADLEQMLSFLHGKNIVTLEGIRQEHLEQFRDSLLAEKYTPKSVSRKLNAIKTFFRWLISENFTSFDPSQNVSHPKIESTPPKFLSPLEYRALRDVVRGEIASLKLANVKAEEVKVEAYATQPERTIPLNSPAKEALDAYVKMRPKTESPYVFVSKNGKPLAVRNIRAAIDRYMQKADVPAYSVNDLRTTFIIENLKAGVDLVLLSQVSGHKRLSTTERYLELAEVKEPGKKQKLEEL